MFACGGTCRREGGVQEAKLAPSRQSDLFTNGVLDNMLRILSGEFDMQLSFERPLYCSRLQQTVALQSHGEVPTVRVYVAYLV
jgi:hypothetical protein